MWLKIPMDPVALSEALPFLVCTVGFDKPMRLARAVFGHPGVTSPYAPATVSVVPPKPSGEIILESLTQVYVPILRDYILEIAVLVVGAYSHVSGLREVCALAALILGLDCLLLCTFLSAILGIMIEVRLLFSCFDVFRHSWLPIQFWIGVVTWSAKTRSYCFLFLSYHLRFPASFVGIGSVHLFTFGRVSVL